MTILKLTFLHSNLSICLHLTKLLHAFFLFLQDRLSNIFLPSTIYIPPEKQWFWTPAWIELIVGHSFISLLHKHLPLTFPSIIIMENIA